MLTWGEIKAALTANGVQDTDTAFIHVVVPGTAGTPDVTIPGYVVVASDVVLEKAVDRVDAAAVV